jgi:hypothetical protein
MENYLKLETAFLSGKIHFLTEFINEGIIYRIEKHLPKGLKHISNSKTRKLTSNKFTNILW